MNQQRSNAPKTALNRFERVLGTWALTGRTRDSEVDNVTGWTTFEFLPGGFFLRSDSELDFDGHVSQSTEIIAYDDASETFPAQVFSSMSATIFTYVWEIQGNQLTHTGMGARYTGTLSEDGTTITGGWRPTDGTKSTRVNDYDVVMTRVEEPSATQTTG